MQTINVSVIICTWNRAELLDKTLHGLRGLRIPEGIRWELIVVNNNCTDNTDEVLARHAEALPIRRLFEPEPGLSRARNLAIAHAEGELLIWTDDDVIVDPDWIAEYIDAARRWPEAKYFGGTVEPWFVEQAPTWVLANLKALVGPFAIRQFGDAVRPIASDEAVFGASMAFRREVLAQNRFDTSLGRVGGKLISGEETAIFERLKEQNATGIWVGTARLRHLVPPGRVSKGYVWNWFVGWGMTDARLTGREDVLHWFGVPRYQLRRLLLAVPGAVAFAVTSAPRCFDAFRTAAESLGVLRERRRTRWSPKSGGAAGTDQCQPAAVGNSDNT